MEMANIPSDPVVMMLSTKRTTTAAEVAEFMLAVSDDFSRFSLLLG